VRELQVQELRCRNS